MVRGESEDKDGNVKGKKEMSDMIQSLCSIIL